jgi:hypothetical protein
MADSVRALPNTQSLLNRIARVRSRHCEVGGDNDAYELARWAFDALGVVGTVEAWFESRTDEDADEEDRDFADSDLVLAWGRFVHDREKHGPSNG